MAFGTRGGGVMGCSRLTDAIRFIHTNKGFSLVSYIDDMILTELPEQAESSFKELCSLLEDLRIPVSPVKLAPPTTSLNCLGIVIDSVAQTVSIPSEKLRKY